MKFEDLRIYDKDFNLLIILPRYVSVNWELKFFGYGDGEIQLQKTEEIVKILTENKYLFIVQGDIQSLVTGYKIADVCTLFTRTPEWMLTKFAVKKFSVADINISVGGKCTSEMLVEYVLNEFLHKDFCVEFRGSGADESDVTGFVQNAVSDIYSVIKEIVKDPKAGFEFYRDFSDGHFIFEMKRAKSNENLVFCDKYKTSYDSEYNFDIQNEASGGIFYHTVTSLGEWDAYQNIPEITFVPSNYGKYYTVSEDGMYMGQKVYKGDILICRIPSGVFEVADVAEPFLVEIASEEKGIFSWTAALFSDETDSAEKELSEKKALDMVTCMTGLSYKEDFNLGDIVKVVFCEQEFSCEKEKMISEIHIWDEAEGSGAVPTITDIS